MVVRLTTTKNKFFSIEKYWVGYQNPEPFVWFVLISVQFIFPELAQIKTSRTKGSGFWYPTQCVSKQFARKGSKIFHGDDTIKGKALQRNPEEIFLKEGLPP